MLDTDLEQNSSEDRSQTHSLYGCNDANRLNQEIKLNDIAYGGKQRGRAEEMWRFPQVDFAKIAEDFGCAGIRVEKPGDLGGALEPAIRWLELWPRALSRGTVTRASRSAARHLATHFFTRG